jgi:hypothetical protein
MKKFLIALLTIGVLFTSAAEAGNKKHFRHRPHHNNGHNHWNGNHNGNHSNNNHHNNYYYDNRRNYNNNNGGNFYKDPYFWGGIAGGLIGGAILRDQYYDEPMCRYVWTQVFVPGYGYQDRQVEVCD